MTRSQPEKLPTISDVLRAAITESGMTLAAIERDTGIDRTSIGRFMTGDRSLHLEAADQLARFFGMYLTKEAAMASKTKAQKPFREWSLPEMKASMASMMKHFLDRQRVYHEEKERRSKIHQQGR